MIEVELLSSEQAPDVFGIIDSDSDLNLTLEEVTLHLAASAAKRGANPGVGGEPSIEALVGEIFKSEDEDGDGLISHREFSGPKRSRDEL